MRMPSVWPSPSAPGLVHALYSDKTPEGVARYENVQELLNALQGFVENPLNEEAQSLSDFLIDVASSPTPTTKTTTTTKSTS